VTNRYSHNLIYLISCGAKSPKKTQSEGVRFLLIRHTVPYCQKYTPSDCFFVDFAHWVHVLIVNGKGKVVYTPPSTGVQFGWRHAEDIGSEVNWIIFHIR